MSELFQAEGTVQSVKTLVDGTVRSTIDYQEVSPEGMTKLFRQLRKPAWILVKSSEIVTEDIPTIEPDVEMGETKTPGQRLRAVLFVMWQQGSQKQPFDVYYRVQVERIIERVKEQLA